MTTAHALHIDFESRSAVDLRVAGLYRYAADASTGLWCMGYAFDDEPVKVWLPHEPPPERVIDHVRAGGRLYAWNSQFERIMWKFILAARFGWPDTRAAQWEDPMVWALAMGFPAQLGAFGQAMALTIQKDDEGRRLMLQMAKPRDLDTPGKEWWNSEEKVQRLAAYCARDVETERAATEKLLPLTPAERELWLLDQAINDRGVKVDREFIYQAQRVAHRRTVRLSNELADVTSGYVKTVTNTGRLGEWLMRAGFPMESLDKEAVTNALARPDLPPEVRRALEIRQAAAKSSTKKLDAFLAAVGEDNRVRGVFQFHKAGTGRWASTLIQLHNLPRGKKQHLKRYDELCDLIMLGDDDAVEREFGEPMDAVASVLRGCLVPAFGHVLAVRDYSAIEARGLVWLSGERWKLDAFRAYDMGFGDDQYRLAFARAFNIAVEDVTDAERQIGKVMELALGYAGGVGAFVSMAKVYGLDLVALAAKVAAMPVPADVRERAVGGWKQRGAQSGMHEAVWLGCEILKILWRNAHPATVNLWYALERAAIEAVENAGSTVTVENCPPGIRYRVANGHLWCRLPSGRLLCYPFPATARKRMPWKEEDGGAVYKKSLRYMGESALTRHWEPQWSYGGHLIENIVQALCRDLLAAAMRRCEAAGIRIVLHVHDELVAEVPAPDGAATLQRMGGLMEQLPDWAAGMPVASAGFLTHRYRKE